MGRDAEGGALLKSYAEFLADKARWDDDHGFEVDPDRLNVDLFDFQRDITRWSLRKGRSCIWADCGLGKSPMQLEWARLVCAHTGGNVLILAPLAVSAQTVREGQKFGIHVTPCRSQADVRPGVNITNYEMLEHFDPASFVGVVVDESSILKSYTGRFRTQVIESFARTPYRLACTATPAPNDFMEIANHAEFVGAMTRAEMLAMFFVHDGGETQEWRLKGHAREDFWRWVCSWAVMLRNPADLGYDGSAFVLPPIEYVDHVIEVDPVSVGVLFEHESLSLQERRRARKVTIGDRVAKCAELVNRTPGPWIVWCDLNDESRALVAAIPGAVEVEGSDTREHKEATAAGFVDGSVRVVVSKPRIFGSIDYSIFSPPFASLYTYSNSDRDMGNCASHEEFQSTSIYLVRRALPRDEAGPAVSFHCMNLPTSKVRDGVIGLRDFRGELIRAFEARGWIYHSEVCIWKDPVTAMQRTKALGPAAQAGEEGLVRCRARASPTTS
jgi:hypothetical protein